MELFKDIQPVKTNRTTRSRSKELRRLKRVINFEEHKGNFEHFCSISISARIPNVSSINDNIPIEDLNCSKKFLEKRYIVMDVLKPVVTLLPNVKRRSKSNLKKRNEMNNNDCIDEIIDITDDVNVEPVNLDDDDDDDVILVPNVVNDPSIIIDDSVIAGEQLSDVPQGTNKQNKKLIKKDSNQESDSIIEILDITNDVTENTPTKKTVSRKSVNLKFCFTNIKKRATDTKLKCSFKQISRIKRKKQLNKKRFQFFAKNVIKKELRKEMKVNEHCQLNQKCYCQLKTDTCCTLSPKLSLSSSNTQNNMSNVEEIKKTGLREIIIDGSNVAIAHSNHRVFSVEGLEIAIEHFVKKGHKVTAFVPKYWQGHRETTNRQLLNKLAEKGYVVFTPSREVDGRRITPYDDRYIIQYANICEGIVVSSDNYRDLFMEKPEWRQTIRTRLLMPTWVGNILMFPEDPLGRYGPRLNDFLKFPQ